MILQETDIRQPETEMTEGVLKHVKSLPKSAKINFNPEVKFDSFAPLVRAAGITDAEWSEIQQHSADVINNAQVTVDNSVQAQRIAEAVSQRELLTAALSGNDATASAVHAANLTNVINSGVPSGAASEIATQVARAAEAAKAAAAQSNDPEDKKAAEVANILSAQATAQAARVKAEELSKIQAETENTLLSLIDKAKKSGTIQDKENVTAAQQRMTDANNNLMAAQELHSDAAQYASMIKSQADIDAATVAYALLNPVTVPQTEVVNKTVKAGFLDRIVNYIYKQIYS